MMNIPVKTNMLVFGFYEYIGNMSKILVFDGFAYKKKKVLGNILEI